MIPGLAGRLPWVSDERCPRAVVEVRHADGTLAATVTVDGCGELPGLFVVDVAARVALAARVLGWDTRLRDPDPALADVARLCAVPIGGVPADGPEPG